MRAIAFFEDQKLTETTMYAERWVDFIVDQCFASQNLEPYALVSGVPSLTPEFAEINFGSIEVPDMRTVIRVMFELPDLPGDDLFMMFAGDHVKELSAADPANYSEVDKTYINVVSGCFGAISHTFQTDLPEVTEFKSFLSVPNVEASRFYAMTAVLHGAKVEQAQQVYAASPELVRQAIEQGQPLPPGLDPAVITAATATVATDNQE